MPKQRAGSEIAEGLCQLTINGITRLSWLDDLVVASVAAIREFDDGEHACFGKVPCPNGDKYAEADNHPLCSTCFWLSYGHRTVAPAPKSTDYRA